MNVLLAALLLAAPAPMAITGGALDPAWPDADVFLGIPPEPRVPPGRACAVAARYVRLVNAGEYAAVAALYADDATFLDPMRPNLHGRAEIDAFYTRQIGAMKPRIRAVTYLGNASECMVELAREVMLDSKPRTVLVSVDHFVVRRDGRISAMVAFARPVRNTHDKN
ncbi:MAG: nuclear transport factor 2 family protein [Sphingomonadales bacterium]|nr:nuclear transport factor 2 family protein [Sphingomonadales bacterium]